MLIAILVLSSIMCCLSLLWMLILMFNTERWRCGYPLLPVVGAFIVTRLFSTPARVQKILIYSLMAYTISAICVATTAFLAGISS